MRLSQKSASRAKDYEESEDCSPAKCGFERAYKVEIKRIKRWSSYHRDNIALSVHDRGRGELISLPNPNEMHVH
jgi:hypothetical protein